MDGLKPYIGCIIQARLTSTRFPRKITEPIEGIPVLEHLVNRCRLSRYIDRVIIAAPHSPEVCLNETIFIGSEHDVLDRYYQAAKEHKLDVIVRVTSDCPIVPVYELNRCIKYFLEGHTDYVTNIGVLGRFGTPDGWDVEVFSFKALEKAWLYAEEREHVTKYMKEDVTLNPIVLNPLKLSVDTRSDLNIVREFYELERKAYSSDWGNGKFCNELHQVYPSTTGTTGSNTYFFEG